jgi:hypothetical protein
VLSVRPPSPKLAFKRSLRRVVFVLIVVSF